MKQDAYTGGNLLTMSGSLSMLKVNLRLQSLGLGSGELVPLLICGLLVSKGSHPWATHGQEAVRKTSNYSREVGPENG